MTTNSRGLTLIELILVMVILLVLMVLVTPRMNDFSRGQVLRSHSETILAMLRTARTRAATDGTAYRVVFDPTNRTIALQMHNTNTYVSPTQSDQRIIELPDDLTLTTESIDGYEIDTFVFQPTGEATPGRVILTDSHGEHRYIYARTPLEDFALAGEGDEENTLP